MGRRVEGMGLVWVAGTCRWLLLLVEDNIRLVSADKCILLVSVGMCTRLVSAGIESDRQEADMGWVSAGMARMLFLSVVDMCSRMVWAPKISP